MTTIETLDTRHEGKAGIVAVYAVRHAKGALLVDCGPGSTVPTVLQELRAHDLEAREITDVVLTHIHLDHGGAAGWWAQQGARVHVHPVGAPHLLNPDKLLASAQRIYGADMERLWGDFLAVPEAQLIVHHDNETFQIGEHMFTALDTPGHAEHHFAYQFEDTLFTGDVGGVRVSRLKHVRLPTPPPEIHLGKWRMSIQRLRDANAKFIAPTHYGIYDDVPWHLDALERALDDMEGWAGTEMQTAPTQEQFRTNFAAFLDARARADGYDPLHATAFGDAAGAVMTADGLYRYWKKYRMS